MAVAAGRLSLPHVADGPMAGAEGRRLDRTEDWSEIEAFLASPAPAHEPRGRRVRRLAVPLMVSTAAASAVFAGLLVTVLAGLPGRCLQADDCRTPAAPTATATDAPAATPLAPTNRVADADRPQPDAASAVVQGRSVSEGEAKPDVATPGEAAPADPEPRHRRAHRHRY